MGITKVVANGPEVRVVCLDNGRFAYESVKGSGQPVEFSDFGSLVATHVNVLRSNEQELVDARKSVFAGKKYKELAIGGTYLAEYGKVPDNGQQAQAARLWESFDPESQESEPKQYSRLFLPHLGFQLAPDGKVSITEIPKHGVEAETLLAMCCMVLSDGRGECFGRVTMYDREEDETFEAAPSWLPFLAVVLRERFGQSCLMEEVSSVHAEALRAEPVSAKEEAALPEQGPPAPSDTPEKGERRIWSRDEAQAALGAILEKHALV